MCSIGLNDATGRRIIEIESLELIYNPITLGWAYRWFLWFLSRYCISWTLAWSGGKWVLVARFWWFFDLWNCWDLYYSFTTQNMPIYVFYGSIHSRFGLRYTRECHFDYCRTRLIQKIVIFRRHMNILRQKWVVLTSTMPQVEESSKSSYYNSFTTRSR